jgi:hypothetical protein
VAPNDDLRSYTPQGPAPVQQPDPRFQAPITPPPSARLRQPGVGEYQTPKVPAPDNGLLPVDVPQFAIARKGVASGQRPFTEGLDWLRSKGYRTVLYVRAPGEDDRLARQQFEAKGFRYLTLQVSPTTLNREIVDEFNRIVTDAGNQPLFVYDRDSSLVGGLWYLHFRTVDGYTDDRAAIEAGRLGLNIDADGGPHKEMWLAIQRFLQTNKPTGRFARVHTASLSKADR